MTTTISSMMTTYIGWGSYYKAIFYLLLAAIILLAASGVTDQLFLQQKDMETLLSEPGKPEEVYSELHYKLQLQSSSITEFNELQAALKDLTERSHREYMALRGVYRKCFA